MTAPNALCPEFHHFSTFSIEMHRRFDPDSTKTTGLRLHRHLQSLGTQGDALRCAWTDMTGQLAHSWPQGARKESILARLEKHIRALGPLLGFEPRVGPRFASDAAQIMVCLKAFDGALDSMSRISLRQEDVQVAAQPVVAPREIEYYCGILDQTGRLSYVFKVVSSWGNEKAAAKVDLSGMTVIADAGFAAEAIAKQIVEPGLYPHALIRNSRYLTTPDGISDRVLEDSVKGSGRPQIRLENLFFVSAKKNPRLHRGPTFEPNWLLGGLHFLWGPLDEWPFSVGWRTQYLEYLFAKEDVQGASRPVERGWVFESWSTGFVAQVIGRVNEYMDLSAPELSCRIVTC